MLHCLVMKRRRNSQENVYIRLAGVAFAAKNAREKVFILILFLSVRLFSARKFLARAY